MSIWNGVNRQEFELSVANLQQIAPSQRPLSGGILIQSQIDARSASHSQNHSLPLSVEKQICDDIAFLAARESSEGGVTATTLQESEHNNSTTMNLTATEGISDEARVAIIEVLRLLEQCAHRSIDTKQCASQILDKILRLHRGRILERLGLSESKRVKQRLGDPVSISGRLRELLSRTFVSGNFVVRTALLLEIRTMQEAIEHLKHETANSILPFQNVVEVASSIAKPNESLTQKLIRAGFSPDDAQRKEIRQIKGLANYKHCCNRLTTSAHKYKTILGSINLYPIPAYPVERWPAQGGIKHYVHAEIQLLIYHEMQTGNRLPRYIGVSKRACFLCYGFMQAYGTYVMPETHGEVLPQWTVPDRGDYSKRSQTRLRRALVGTKDAVTSALAVPRARNCRFPPNIQSRNHSIIFSLTSASSSTTGSVNKIDRDLPLRSDAPNPESCKVPGSSSNASSATIRESPGSNNSVQESPNTSQERYRPEAIKTGISSIFEINWLTLFLPLAGDENTHCTTAEESSNSKGASQFVWQAKRIAEPSICTAAQVIKMTDLGVGETISLKGTTTGELDVVFGHDGRRAIGVHLARTMPFERNGQSES